MKQSCVWVASIGAAMSLAACSSGAVSPIKAHTNAKTAAQNAQQGGSAKVTVDGENIDVTDEVVTCVSTPQSRDAPAISITRATDDPRPGGTVLGITIVHDPDADGALTLNKIQITRLGTDTLSYDKDAQRLDPISGEPLPTGDGVVNRNGDTFDISGHVTPVGETMRDGDAKAFQITVNCRE